jgi:CBS-domain-containing membrane protein
VTAVNSQTKASAIADIMSREIRTAKQDADVWHTLSQMRNHGVRRMPVVNARRA